jgi:hypothetical protein
MATKKKSAKKSTVKKKVAKKVAKKKSAKKSTKKSSVERMVPIYIGSVTEHVPESSNAKEALNRIAAKHGLGSYAPKADGDWVRLDDTDTLEGISSVELMKASSPS